MKDGSMRTPSRGHAVLHAAKPALLTRDIAAESHSAVRRMIGKELVQPGFLRKEAALILAQTQDEEICANLKELGFGV